ncbi:MAG: alpha/beta hydrolase family protein [Candidatus Korobacteraceae bacterium]
MKAWSNLRSVLKRQTNFVTCALILLLALGVAASLHAQGRAECSVVKSEILARPVRYCAFLPPGFEENKTRHYPVLYYLHGLGDNEQSLLNLGGWDVISESRRQGKIGDFVVLAPSAGHTFYVNSADGKVRYEDFFMREFMPQMEKKYRAEGTRATRGITGVSMGGYGALRLAFKYPDKFAAVSAQMPALIAELPKNMSASAPGSPGAVLGDVYGSPINRAYFDRNNVFYFARTDSASNLKRMKIYFNVGNNDDYGFEQGAQRLDKLLTSRGIPHEFHIYPGGHDAQFVISHFGDVIEWQWKTIGAGK